MYVLYETSRSRFYSWPLQRQTLKNFKCLHYRFCLLKPTQNSILWNQPDLQHLSSRKHQKWMSILNCCLNAVETQTVPCKKYLWLLKQMKVNGASRWLIWWMNLTVSLTKLSFSSRITPHFKLQEKNFALSWITWKMRERYFRQKMKPGFEIVQKIPSCSWTILVHIGSKPR